MCCAGFLVGHVGWKCKSPRVALLGLGGTLRFVLTFAAVEARFVIRRTDAFWTAHF
jgi:hypothetical protein